MMLNEYYQHAHPTLEIPSWSNSDDSTLTNPSTPYKIHEAIKALQRYLPSNSPEPEFSLTEQPENPDSSCDNFRMYEFKVRKCMHAKSHDWTECPYAHPGEKARRRDPRRYNYSGHACQDFRKGCCTKGDACEFSHGVFECWLHPSRYRTQACKDGRKCARRVCFFAHSVDQLRVVGSSGDFRESPESPVGMLSRSLESLQLSSGKGRLLANNWGVMQMGGSGSPVYGSPRGGIGSSTRGEFCSLPNTPSPSGISRGGGWFDGVWEEEPVMERVESGRDLRMKMFERISKESCLERVDPDPDVGWVSDLLN